MRWGSHAASIVSITISNLIALSRNRESTKTGLQSSTAKLLFPSTIESAQSRHQLDCSEEFSQFRWVRKKRIKSSQQELVLLRQYSLRVPSKCVLSQKKARSKSLCDCSTYAMRLPTSSTTKRNFRKRAKSCGKLIWTDDLCNIRADFEKKSVQKQRTLQ